MILLFQKEEIIITCTQIWEMEFLNFMKENQSYCDIEKCISVLINHGQVAYALQVLELITVSHVLE